MAINKMVINNLTHFSFSEDYYISSIQNWITNNKTYLQFAINETSCKKWSKWYFNKKYPYPCVCTQRDKYCIEIELYYELQKVVEICEQGTYFEQAIEEFNIINKLDNDSLCSWIKNYEMVGSKLFFSSTIIILRNPEENDKLTIQLNPDEFRIVIQFQEIFNKVYYSEEFQTNINQ